MNPHSRIWVFLFFFISGATGLIYEVVWTRLLTLVMGNTNYSITTVLTAFMGGLALGSYAGGRLIDRHFNPLAVYALLEGAIGVYCLFIPALIDGAFPLFQAIYLNPDFSYTGKSFFRFLICGAILFIPTSFMGATLPILSKFVSRESGWIGRDVGTLYSINTFGAVLGAVTSAFFFMRLLGVHGTIYLAAGFNLFIAVIVLALFRPGFGGSRQSSRDGKALPAPLLSWRAGCVLLCFGLSGLCALIYQIAWNRILSLLLGSSVYAFSLILTTFILGLALGTICFSRWIHRLRDPLTWFGILQLGIGFSALAGLPLFGEIPFVNRWVYQNWEIQFSSVQFSNFLIIFSLLFFPTFFMGAQFPVVVKLATHGLASLGHNVGRVYSSNTVGTILGSFLGGFVLIPLIGIQNTVLFAVFLNVLLGVGLLSFSHGMGANMKMYALPLVVLALFWGGRNVEAWDKAIISSGSYIPYRIEDLSNAERRKNKILFYREGTHTTVTTELSVSGNIFLRVNGKTDASLALDMRTQLLSGYLPMFISPHPRTALVIGQGSGITLGSVEQFPVKNIDLVEISPTVIEGSRYFAPFNHHALSDPRLHVILEDGRNHVALSDKKYDVIVSEPSNPWISGIGALFTLDFFELLKKRLNPGGVACIWVHTNMSPDNFKSITRSFITVFPHVTMWESIVGDDYLLIGSAEPFSLPYETIQGFLADETKGRDLGKIGVHNFRDLISLMILNRDGLIRFSGQAPLHTDDNSLLEFNTPKYIYKDERNVLVRQLTPFAGVDLSLIRFNATGPETRKRILDQMAQAERSESQVAEIKRKARIDRLLDQGRDAFNSGGYSQALTFYKEILNLDEDHVMTYLNTGNVYMATHQYEEAEKAYKKTLAINPYYIFGAVALSKLYLNTKKYGKAARVLEDVLKWYKGDGEVMLYLGLAYAFQDDPGGALREMEQAVKIDPKYAPAHYYLGLQYRNRDARKAKRHLRTFLELAPLDGGNQKMIASAKNLLKKF
ncbi:MAG: fused MFS/spermidine synthase [Nitrospinaceae bacterium]